LTLLPTGAGESETIDTELAAAFTARIRPGGDSMLVTGISEQHGLRIFEQPLAGGSPRPITPPSVIEAGPSAWRGGGAVVSEMGEVVAPGTEFPWVIYPPDGGEPRPIHALTEADLPLYWSRDRRYIYCADGFEPPVDIWQIDIDSGDRQLWRRVQPTNAAGVSLLGNIILVAEADAYVISYMRVLSTLYLVEGLH
jgi:hypothetical protein